MTSIRHITNKAIKSEGVPNILSLPYDGMFERNLCKTGCNIYCHVPSSSQAWRNYTDYNPPNLFYINNISTFGNNITYDAVICNDKLNQYDRALQIAKSFHIPLIVVDHATYIEQLNPAHITQIEESVKAHKFVSVDETIYQNWGQKGEVIPYGIDIPSTTGKEKDIPFMIMGKFSDNEIPSVRNISEELGAQVYGDNPGFSKPVNLWLNFIELFQRTKVFINLSIHTDISIELLTAMACDCGIVSNNPTIIRNLLENEKNAYLVRNFEDYISFCKRMIQNESFRIEAAKLNKKILEKFDTTVFTNKWNNVFNEIKQQAFITYE